MADTMLKRESSQVLSSRRTVLQSLFGVAVVGASGSGLSAKPVNGANSPAVGGPLWLTLPDTPSLPPARDRGVVQLNGTPIFFSQFGDGPHVLLLHGGLANSQYWGHQVAELSRDFLVTVMDTRGHGRSAVISDVFSYAQFASDVVEFMKLKGIVKSSIVGWSDGAITGIQLALVKPELISSLFAFGANTNLQGLRAGGARSRVFSLFSERCRREYLALSPHPERWARLQAGLGAMWRSQPTMSRRQLSTIDLPVIVVDGEHDEIIKREHMLEIAASIPRAALAVMEQVSHFALLQDPAQFNAHLTEFLFKTFP